MSVTEAQTGRTSIKKMLRRKLTCSKCLFLGNSTVKAGNRSCEECSHNGSNCTCNMTEISVQSCEGKMEVETVSPTERQRHSTHPEAHRSEQNRFTQKLNALKKVFSTSLCCFTRTLTPGEGSRRDEAEYHAVTIFNRHTRDSVDLNTVGGFSATQIHHFSNNNIVVPKLQPQANPLWLKAFWRQKGKKASSPFLLERIGETERYVSEGITVLANEHADESRTPSTYPEMLTVSVDVTALTLKVKGSDEESEASKTPSHVSNDMKVMAGPAGNLSSSSSSGKIPQSLDSCIAQSSTMSQGHSSNKA